MRWLSLEMKVVLRQKSGLPGREWSSDHVLGLPSHGLIRNSCVLLIGGMTSWQGSMDWAKSGDDRVWHPWLQRWRSFAPVGTEDDWPSFQMWAAQARTHSSSVSGFVNVSDDNYDNLMALMALKTIGAILIGYQCGSNIFSVRHGSFIGPKMPTPPPWKMCENISLTSIELSDATIEDFGGMI